MTGSAQTLKSISFIWIVWSTLAHSALFGPFWSNLVIFFSFFSVDDYDDNSDPNKVEVPCSFGLMFGISFSIFLVWVAKSWLSFLKISFIGQRLSWKSTWWVPEQWIGPSWWCCPNSTKNNGYGYKEVCRNLSKNLYKNVNENFKPQYENRGSQ